VKLTDTSEVLVRWGVPSTVPPPTTLFFSSEGDQIKTAQIVITSFHLRVVKLHLLRLLLLSEIWSPFSSFPNSVPAIRFRSAPISEDRGRETSLLIARGPRMPMPSFSKASSNDARCSDIGRSAPPAVHPTSSSPRPPARLLPLAASTPLWAPSCCCCCLASHAMENAQPRIFFFDSLNGQNGKLSEGVIHGEGDLNEKSQCLGLDKQKRASVWDRFQIEPAARDGGGNGCAGCAQLVVASLSWRHITPSMGLVAQSEWNKQKIRFSDANRNAWVGSNAGGIWWENSRDVKIQPMLRCTVLLP